jgi:hypothetical protein
VHSGFQLKEEEALTLSLSLWWERRPKSGLCLQQQPACDIGHLGWSVERSILGIIVVIPI